MLLLKGQAQVNKKKREIDTAKQYLTREVQSAKTEKLTTRITKNGRRVLEKVDITKM